MEMSAPTPGTGPNVGPGAGPSAGPNVGGSAGSGPDPAVAAAHQEVVTLRGILEAIQDALVAATNRLEALEARLEMASPLAGDGSALDPLSRTARPVAHWKLTDWTPTGGTDVVTGETLRTRREALGISQAAVAHAAHCSRGLVAEVERGKRRSAQTLAHIDSVLDRLEKQARRN